MLFNICSNPDLMSVMKIVNIILTIAKVTLPILIIVLTTIDIIKPIMSGESNDYKVFSKKIGIRLVTAILVFLIPSIVDITIHYVSDDVDVLSCFNDISAKDIQEAYLRQAELLVTKAERTLDIIDYNSAYYYVSRLEDSEEKDAFQNRLDSTNKARDDKSASAVNIVPKTEENTTPSTTTTTETPGEPLEIVGSYYPTTTAIPTPNVELSSEPAPNYAINYWETKGKVKNSDFIYPKDKATQLSLGAWPKNIKDIPTQLTSMKTYQNGILIFPTTPYDGKYTSSYTHTGADIDTYFGTPVYSPVNGSLYYSTWGKTVNKGSDETAYSVRIMLDTPFKYNGVNIDAVFLTHMSGIIYRCEAGKCNRKIKQGELVGFVGTASGSSTTGGWAPHLHITYYNSNDYDGGLKTPYVENLYGIPNGVSGYEIHAGG